MNKRKFIIDSIKMDLHRVINATGDITKALPTQSIEEFLDHADRDFGKLDPTAQDSDLRSLLRSHRKNLVNSTSDPHKRLRWTEEIMTIRNRL